MNVGQVGMVSNRSGVRLNSAAAINVNEGMETINNYFDEIPNRLFYPFGES